MQRVTLMLSDSRREIQWTGRPLPELGSIVAVDGADYIVFWGECSAENEVWLTAAPASARE